MRRYLCDKHTPDNDIVFPIISRLMQSNAEIVIVPMQDYLKKGNAARMNTPSTIGDNWTWRLTQGELSQKLCDDILSVTKPYGR